jgi:hypothetical protein
VFVEAPRPLNERLDAIEPGWIAAKMHEHHQQRSDIRGLERFAEMGTVADKRLEGRGVVRTRHRESIRI